MENIIHSVKSLSIGFRSKKNDEISILRNITTNIKKGETVGIVGESGSGKSTLALAMMGYVKQGLYTIKGECLFKSSNLLEMKNKDLEQIRGRKIAMIPQNAGQSLTPNLKIGYQIDEALRLHTNFNKFERDKKISELLNKVRLPSPETMAFRYPHELSGGQQQRVGIARSLAVEPDIWFLDEPFSALDPLIRKEMQDEFLRLQDKLQKTIMFITHDFDEALKLADRIAIMKDGIIEQLDTPANIVLNPATEYVRKFTEEVPREKVLLIGDVMDSSTSDLGELKVSKDEIIENVAEKILTQEKSVAVIDNNNKIVGSINPTKIINTVFGGRKNTN